MENWSQKEQRQIKSCFWKSHFRHHQYYHHCWIPVAIPPGVYHWTEFGLSPTHGKHLSPRQWHLSLLWPQVIIPLPVRVPETEAWTWVIRVTVMVMWPGVAQRGKVSSNQCYAGQDASFTHYTGFWNAQSRNIYVTNWSFVFPSESVFPACLWQMYWGAQDI